jgi:hypothetical protein
MPRTAKTARELADMIADHVRVDRRLVTVFHEGNGDWSCNIGGDPAETSRMFAQAEGFLTGLRGRFAIID